jgi:4,5-DOPA dioxygenase extradiol
MHVAGIGSAAVDSSTWHMHYGNPERSCNLTYTMQERSLLIHTGAALKEAVPFSVKAIGPKMNASPFSRMPAVFFGHGNPMYALEDNVYTDTWKQIGQSLPRPKAILAVSAHWCTRGTAVTAMQMPQTIHDFGNFPQALFDVRYPAQGDPALASRIRELLSPTDVHMDQSWGLDHGTWAVLLKIYPNADIPVVQLSIDATQSPAYHYNLARRLAPLRDEGILIMGSGNVVHNLRTMVWGNAEPYDWAVSFNDQVKACLLDGTEAELVNYAAWGNDARLSVPSAEHFLPLIYVIATKQEGETISIPIDRIDGGSISMLSAVIDSPSKQKAE